MKTTKGIADTPSKRNVAILPIFHARAKASAAMHGLNLQEWVGEAICEKLDREERTRKVGA